MLPFPVAVVLAHWLMKRARGEELTVCDSGYSAAKSAQVLGFPNGTVVLPSMSSIHCVMQCYQTNGCLQLYYNAVNGTCYVVTTPIPLNATTGGSVGSLISVPNLKNTCSGIQCPTNSLCKTDCSHRFSGPMCVADNNQCAVSTETVKSKHYYSAAFSDETDIGVVQTVSFLKSANDTGIRIQWYANTRGYTAAEGCSRYYVSFNGSECTNPAEIDFINYGSTHADIRHLSELDGICYGLPSGLLNISINVGPCNGRPLSNSLTGFLSSRSMWIREIKTSPNGGYSQCLSLPVFNTQYRTISEEYGGVSGSVMTMMYNKTTSSTILRMKYLTAAGVNVPYSGALSIFRWFITVNGAECNPKSEIVLGLLSNGYTGSRNNMKTRTLEGLCPGLASGLYNITVNRITLISSSNATTYTGWNHSVSRLIIDEARIGSQVQAVINSNGRIMKLPSFNYQHWSWNGLSGVISNGNVLNITYTKLSDTSGLHLRMAGSGEIYASGCCRWYFTIDGSECSNPGAIEGVTYVNMLLDYHQPGVIDGVCYGLTSGTHIVGYNIGLCANYTTIGNCNTGWNKTFRIMAEEVQPDDAITCSTPFACP